jgi:hypothetical protein
MIFQAKFYFCRICFVVSSSHIFLLQVPAMIRRYFVTVFCLVLMLTVACRKYREVIHFERGSDYVQDVLSWLPVDTETFTAANGPFWISDFIVYDRSNRKVSTEELEKGFRLETLGWFGVLEKTLDRERVVFAAEGSRRFRAPGRLGLMRYEGCQIGIFAYDQSRRMHRFFEESVHKALRVEMIEGQKVAVFQKKSEADIWTLFVANPRDNVVLVATNREYLKEVLSRIGGRTGQRALPESLSEWKYVNREARFWGLRHFDRHEAEKDPTSPLTERPYYYDTQAIGLTYECIPANREKTATITYLSSNPGIHRYVEEHLLGSKAERQGLNDRYRTAGPEAVEVAVTISRFGPLHSFLFFLMGNLGHAVFL